MSEELRPLLFSIAYRMVGGVSDAEDIVQEALVRYQGTLEKGTMVESPKAYLSTVVTRLSIDHLRSARVRRESYVGPWLPEPLLTDPAPGPSDHAELTDSLSLAFLVLLESLSPVERAVFLLREVFGYPYEDVALVVDRSEDNCRQLASRARRQLDARRPRFEVSRRRREELTERFVQACRTGDTEGLVAMLAADAIGYTDGGGKALAARRPIYGADRVARFLVGIARPERSPEGYELRAVEVNGQPGRLLLDSRGKLTGVISLDIADDVIQAVRIVVNPEKLRHLSRSLEA